MFPTVCMTNSKGANALRPPLSVSAMAVSALAPNSVLSVVLYLRREPRCQRCSWTAGVCRSTGNPTLRPHESIDATDLNSAARHVEQRPTGAACVLGLEGKVPTGQGCHRPAC